jgi:hypothetical protein
LSRGGRIAPATTVHTLPFHCSINGVGALKVVRETSPTAKHLVVLTHVTPCS